MLKIRYTTSFIDLQKKVSLCQDTASLSSFLEIARSFYLFRRKENGRIYMAEILHDRETLIPFDVYWKSKRRKSGLSGWKMCL